MLKNPDYSGDSLRKATLNSTNYWRERFSAKPLEWDGDLATYAQEHAAVCKFEHSGGPYGENLAAGYSAPVTAIDGWAFESEDFKWMKPKFAKATGHFTQLVWQNTTKLGCGAKACEEGGGDAPGWYLVCEYDPPGNVVDGFRDNLERQDGSGEQLGEESSGPRIGVPWVLLLMACMATSILALYD